MERTITWKRKWTGVFVGRVESVEEDGRIRVGFSGQPSEDPVEARTVVRVRKTHIGREVALQFERGRPELPIIMGILQSQGEGSIETLEADEELVLRSGKASLTLTRAGKVLVRGTYVSSRSSGVHRIQGAAVQIN